MVASIGPDEARQYLLGQLRLNRPWPQRGPAGVRSLLAHLRCFQLDPLDAIGTNADLVALARVDGIARGDVYSAVLPGHAFEHFFKERCLIPASGFPFYRDQAAQTPWWRLRERLMKLPPPLIDAVLADVQARGPLATEEVGDQGRVEAMDWSGWKGTGKASTMALEVLWTRCRIVVCGRRGRGKVYDVPARALPAQHDAPGGTFAEWALGERVESAGLLSRAGGPHWSTLTDVRKGPMPDRWIAEGRLEEVVIEGSRRSYLAPAGWRDRTFDEPDDRMRILGPLDPVLWDRKLVQHAFDFGYVWEVYKPAAKRRWGWYVCPLLHRGRLVGRIEARIRDGALVVSNLWGDPEPVALSACLERHATACGARDIIGP